MHAEFGTSRCAEEEKTLKLIPENIIENPRTPFSEPQTSDTIPGYLETKRNMDNKRKSHIDKSDSGKKFGKTMRNHKCTNS